MNKKLKTPELIIPAIRVRFKNPNVYEMVKGIVERGIYPSVFSMLMYKLEKEPEIISIKESTTDIKMSQTIHEIEGIANMLKGMNTEQEFFKKQMTETAEIMQSLTNELLNVKGQNKVQQGYLTEVIEILSTTNEGLEVLKDLKDRASFSLEEVASAREDDLDVVDKFNQKIEEINNNTLAFGFSSGGSESFDLDDDLLGSDFSDEELGDIVQKFKA